VKEGDRVSLFAQSSCGRCIHCLAGNWVLCESPAPARFPGNHSQYVLLDERHGAALLARFFNAMVIAVEPIAFRRSRAKELGANHVFDPARDDVAAAVKEITRGLGVDVAMDCSGKTDAEMLCLETVRRGGGYAFVGENAGAIPVEPSRHFIRRDLEAIGTWYFSASEHLDMIRLVRRGIGAERLITHRFPIDKAPEAFTTFAAGEAVKVMLLPWE
jgi:threonine dehydrogenase-like Zn-dependent dehydrogenase